MAERLWTGVASALLWVAVGLEWAADRIGAVGYWANKRAIQCIRARREDGK